MAASTLRPSAGARDEHVHLESASASHRGAAASKLARSVVGACTMAALCKGQRPSSCMFWLSWRQALSSILVSASASHRGLAACLLGQSEELARWPHFAKEPSPSSCRLLVVAVNTLHSSARAKDEHVHLDSASASHRGAATSLMLGQSAKLALRLRCANGKDHHPVGGWSPWRQTLSTRVPDPETSTCTLTPPPPRTVEQPQASSVSRRSLHGGSVAQRAKTIIL